MRLNVLPTVRPLFRAICPTSTDYDKEALLRRSGVTSYSPIYISSILGHVKVIEMLIENRADIESPLGPWAMPLQSVAQYRQLQAVRLLIAKRATVDKPARYNSRTTRHSACLESNSAIVQVLIDAGANAMAQMLRNSTLGACLGLRTQLGDYLISHARQVKGSKPKLDYS